MSEEINEEQKKTYIYFVSYFITENDGFSFGSAEFTCKHKIKNFGDISAIAKIICETSTPNATVAIIGYHFLRIENE